MPEPCFDAFRGTTRAGTVSHRPIATLPDYPGCVKRGYGRARLAAAQACSGPMDDALQTPRSTASCKLPSA